MNPTQQTEAIEILKSILTGMEEQEQDVQVYNFLKSINELPEGYVPYWEDEEEHGCPIDMELWVAEQKGKAQL